MSEFGGLWKQQNNPACTKTRHSLQYDEAGHYTEEEEEDEEENEEDALQAGSYAAALLHDES